MIKETPSPARILAMALFTLCCLCLTLFLWLTFGGSLPLRAEGYRFTVALPEAANLAQEADVRIAGVNVGKVKSKQPAAGARRTLVEIELRRRFAPIPNDSRAILRQKTLLGETYIELSPGDRSARPLADGARLPNTRVEPTVELDEILSGFDAPTRDAFKRWMAELDRAFRPSAGRRPAEDLNDALGNFVGFTGQGARLLSALDEQETAVRQLVRNTGRVAGALSRDEGQLRDLITNARRTFTATASRREHLARTVEVLPTFLAESRATADRIARFSHATGPVVHSLQRPARELGPTLAELGQLSPDLRGLFRDLPPLLRASRRGLPAGSRVLGDLEPTLESLHFFLAEANPILSFLSFNQAMIGAFFSNGVTNLVRGTGPTTPWSTQNGIFDSRSFRSYPVRPPFDRGNAYVAPNAYVRAIGRGAVEGFTCPGGREIPEATDTGQPGGEEAAPPCLLQPPSLFQGQQFPRLVRGRAPVVRAPREREGTRPAKP